MRLEGEYFKLLRDALVDAFNTERLRSMVKIGLEVTLEDIVRRGTFKEQVEDLIRWAERKDRVKDLIDAARSENSSNKKLEKAASAILSSGALEGLTNDIGQAAIRQLDETRECPYCTQIIRNTAKMCRYCGIFLEDFTVQQQDKKVLDAAIRREITVGESTCLLVLARDQDSDGLYAIFGLEPEYLLQDEDVRQSLPFKLYYPVDRAGDLLPARIEIVVNSPDFDPPTQSTKIEVQPVIKTQDEYAPVEFLLTPLRTGMLQIIVEVYQQHKNDLIRVGSKPLAIVSLESVSEFAPYRVVSMILETLRWSGFGSLLRAYLSSSQVSISELARRTHMHTSTIHRWTLGTGEPSRHHWQDIVRLAASLELTVQDLDDLLIALSLPPFRELYRISGNFLNEYVSKEMLAQWINAPGEQKLQVFLSHAKTDKEIVRSLYKRLLGDGVNPWLDEVNLLPGMQWKWKNEIVRAVGDSNVVLVCLSQGDIRVSGYVHREISMVLDVADQQPQDAIYLIPVRLEPCDLPTRLSNYQSIDLYEQTGYAHLLQAIKRRAKGGLDR